MASVNWQKSEGQWMESIFSPRKFRYDEYQYQLVINAILISIVVNIIFASNVGRQFTALKHVFVLKKCCKDFECPSIFYLDVLIHSICFAWLGVSVDLFFANGMGLLPDMLNCGWACAGNAGNVFPRNHGLAIPTCIKARASRTCRDACRDR